MIIKVKKPVFWELENAILEIQLTHGRVIRCGIKPEELRNLKDMFGASSEIVTRRGYFDFSLELFAMECFDGGGN